MTYLPALLRFSVTLLFTCLLTPLAFGQTAGRTLEEDFPAKRTVTIKQSRGPVTVLPSTDGRIRVVSKVDIEAKRQEDADALLDQIELDFQESGDGVTITSGMGNIKNWNQTNDRINITFQGGDRIRDIREFNIATKIYLPATPELVVDSRFVDVDIDGRVRLENLRLETSNVNLTGGDLAGDLKVDARFGKIELGSVKGKVTGEMNNVKLRLTSAASIDVKSRFTNVYCSSVGDLTVDGNNDDYEIGTISGEVTIEDRFGDYEFGSTQGARITSNNGKFKVKTGANYRFTGRFANLRAQALQSLNIVESNNANYTVDRLGSVEGSGRFTWINVDRLHGEADLYLTNGGLEVDELVPSFTGITVKGNFSKVVLSTDRATKYRVEADLQFGDLELPDTIRAVRNDREHTRIDFAGHSPGAAGNAPLIKVEGSNTDLRIR